MKMSDADKTRMIGLPYGEKNCDNMLSRFHPIPERHEQTDGRTDLLYQYRASVCLRAIKTRNRFGISFVLFGLKKNAVGSDIIVIYYTYNS